MFHCETLLRKIADTVPQPTEETREGDRPRGPRAVNAPASVLLMIAALCTIHIMRVVLGDKWDILGLYAFALIPARFTDTSGFFMQGSEYWSLFTYGLLHADWVHLGVNCVWLLIFGSVVARVLGSARFLLISILSSLGGGIVMVFAHWGEAVPVIGISAAVSGLMAAAIPIMYAERGVPLTIAQLIRHRRALIFIAVWLAVTTLTGSQGLLNPGSGSIAWEAHLGGFVTGLLAFAALTRRPVHVGGDHAILG
jgi:membrane associated rhomboid family serine protease